MTRTKITGDNANYDADHDVRHVFLAPHGWDYWGDEDIPGIIFKRDKESDALLGFIIMDFSGSADVLRRVLPDYDFSPLFRDISARPSKVRTAANVAAVAVM